MSRALGDLLSTSPSSQPAAFQSWGVVTAVVTGPPNTVTVRLGGSSTATAGLRYLFSYAPTVADTVAIIRNGSDLLVIGKLA